MKTCAIKIDETILAEIDDYAQLNKIDRDEAINLLVKLGVEKLTLIEKESQDWYFNRNFGGRCDVIN